MQRDRNKRWLEKYGPWGARPQQWVPDDRDYDADEQSSLIALIFVVLLVVFSVWVLHCFQQATARTNCLLAGHRNCLPVDDSSTRS